MLLTERDRRIGQIVRELRFERALTQVELSKEADLHEITISEIENGKRTPSARTLRKLARGLKVDVSRLTGGSEQAPRFPGGARSEEHFDTFLDQEAEQRRRRDENKPDDESEEEGNGPGGNET